jgi:RNA polymerase sigma-70 factor (ECF subfamily)
MQPDIKKIIRDINKGDKPAFRKLVEAYQEMAYGLAFRMMNDEEDARDVVQESFIKIWEKIHTYDQNEKFNNWMYRIVSNTAIDRIRKRKPESRYDDSSILSYMPLNNSLDKTLELKESVKLIRLLTFKLPEKQKLVFSLRDLEGLSQHEVEEITGMKGDAVKSNLYHARKFIREQLTAIFSFERRTT